MPNPARSIWQLAAVTAVTYLHAKLETQNTRLTDQPSSGLTARQVIRFKCLYNGKWTKYITAIDNILLRSLTYI